MRGKIEKFARKNRSFDTRLRKRETKGLVEEAKLLKQHATARRELREARRELRRESTPARFLRGIGNAVEKFGGGVSNAQKVLNRAEQNSREWFGGANSPGIGGQTPGLSDGGKMPSLSGPMPKKKRSGKRITIRIDE